MQAPHTPTSPLIASLGSREHKVAAGVSGTGTARHQRAPVGSGCITRLHMWHNRTHRHYIVSIVSNLVAVRT